MRFLILFTAASLLLAEDAGKPMQLPQRIGVLDTVSITLSEVIQRVLTNDRDLEVSRILRDEAGFNVNAAKGVYDPRLGLTANRTHQVFPATSIIAGAANGKLTQNSYNADPSLSGSFPFLGGAYKLDFQQARNTSDSALAGLNPQYPTSLNLNLTQPLWRGLRYDDNRYRIQVAKKNTTLTGDQLRQRVIEVVTQAIEAYWELDFAYRNLEVQVQAVRLAEQQDASNRRQLEQGLLAQVDVVQTQTQIATFRQNVYSAQQSLTQAENGLKQLITADRGDLLWSAALIPEQRPDPRLVVPEIAEATKLALADRPELAQNKIAAEVNRLDLRLSHEKTRPQIDAVGTLTTTGLAGRPLPAGSNPFGNLFGNIGSSLPPALIGSYGQSLSNLAGINYPTASIGLQMSLPLRNRTALAGEQISVAEGRRIRARQSQIELAVEADVRNTLQSVSSAQDRLDAATDARNNSESQYASEQRQFQAGTSSVFLLLQRQTELISARIREIRARADLGRAAAELDRSTAQTIRAQNIRIP